MPEKLIDGHNLTYWNSIDCNLDICPLQASFWDYRPSLALNCLLIALFGLSLLSHIGQGIKYKTWGFLISMFFGCIAEIVGYGGRVWAYSQPFEMNAFLMQICCLTIAPAFLCAGIYLCLSRIVMVFGAETSRIPPKAYTYIFVTCDFISLCLQGAGGGIASTLSQDNKDPANGNNIMLAGLGFQVFTLVLFICLCAEYAYRVKTSTQEFDATHAKLRASRKFRAFLIALSLSTILILIRSIYRVIEMAQGWSGALIKNQTLFFVLEGIMVILAVLVLNVFHPGFCFREAYAKRLQAEKDTDSVS
ncbi:RTA1-domain-containing protein [Choiromyces venosus 120613-1]|uniref:RTA1-domain-containing protein n=1 Tax=Choiromyces venosus 120613-1 TaxID=1336337 RepID=A0A3N4JL21_9PEZI|nr:RTA1-domain-containing protein [Choiromyces venosus 120613-1]